MAKLIYLEADVEITSIIDRLRGMPLENAPVLVLPAQARTLQSSLNARLLAQYSRNLGKRTAIVSSDPRTQAMAVEHGFPTFATIDAWERGVEVYRPAPAASIGAGGAGTAAALRPAGIQAATAVAEAPIRPPQPSPPLEIYKPSFPPPRRRGTRAPLVAAGALALLAVVAGAFYLPSATLTLVVAGTPVNLEQTITGSPAAVAPGATTQVQTTLAEAQEVKVLQEKATGVRAVPPVSATGSVIFFFRDCFLCTVDLRAGTTVSTSTGIKFRTQKFVTVPPFNGSTDPVAVVAMEPGVTGNVDADRITQVEIRDPDKKLHVRNPNPTSGGADAKNLTVVSGDDQKRAEKRLVDELTPKVQQQLAGKAAGTLKPVGDAFLNHETTFDRNAGEEVEQFNATVRVAGKQVLVDDSSVKRLLQQGLQGKVPPGFQLTDDPVKLSYPLESVTPEGNVVFKAKAQGVVRPVFTLADIRVRAKGKSPADARAALTRLPSVQDVQVRQRPLALPLLPLFGSRIFVRVHQLRGDSGSTV